MIRLKECLKNYSFVFLCLVIGFSLVGAQNFGEVISDVEPDDVYDWGGRYFSDFYNLKIRFKDRTEVDFSKAEGNIILSEYGKVLEAEFEVKSSGPFVLGNFKLDLDAGSRVIFKKGELRIENPGKMISKGDVGLVDLNEGWDSGIDIKLSGRGVDFYGLDEVGLSELGYYMDSPKGVKFEGFTIYGEGRVYIDLENKGEPDLDFPGAYISVDPENSRFVIGSNKQGDSIAVMPDSNNPYELKHDVDTDYIAAKVIGGAEPSYVKFTGKASDGYTPEVKAVGNFIIDNNDLGFYVRNNQVYLDNDNSLLREFGMSGGRTASPIHVQFSKIEGGELKGLEDYGGFLVIGNDGAWGYGYDPEFTLGGRYLDAPQNAVLAQLVRRTPHFHFGVSNLLSYNYEMSKEMIEAKFNVRISDRGGHLRDPANVRFLYDLMARIPRGSQITQHIILTPGTHVRGWAHTGGTISSTFNLLTIAHEIGHQVGYRGGFSSDWLAIRGSSVPHVRGYGATRGESVSTIYEAIFYSDDWWRGFAQGQIGFINTPQTSIRMAGKISVLAKHGHIHDYDAARILRNFDINVNPDNPAQTYQEVINRVSRGVA